MSERKVENLENTPISTKYRHVKTQVNQETNERHWAPPLLLLLLALPALSCSSLSPCPSAERDTHRHTHTNQRANPPGERGELVGENFVSYSCLRPKSCKSRGRRYREIRRDRDRWFGERDWLQEERKNKKLACVNWIDRSRVFGKREGKGGNGQELKNGTLESSFDV
jgi:hypothetical protein